MDRERISAHVPSGYERHGRNTASLRLQTLVLLVVALAGCLFAGFADAALLYPLTNPGFETAGATEGEASGWLPYGEGYVRTAHPIPSAGYGICLTNTDASLQAGAYQRLDVQQTILKPIFIGGWVRGEYIELVSEDAWIGASIYAEIYLVSGKVVYWNSTRNEGTFDWRWAGFNTGSLEEVNEPIDHIIVHAILADGTGTACFDDFEAVEFDPYQSAVTVMFDDGLVSAYTEALPVLQQHGFKGTAAIVTDFVGVQGHMSLPQMQELYANGWEIVSHGVTHENLTLLPPDLQSAELVLSKQILKDWGFMVNHCAYPYGGYTAALHVLAERWYVSCRGYDSGSNPQGTYPFDVRVRGVTNTTTPEEVAAWIAEAEKNYQWVVLVFHKIGNESSGEYETTPATFSAMMSVIAKSKISVVTYGQGIERFAIQNPRVRQ